MPVHFFSVVTFGIDPYEDEFISNLSKHGLADPYVEEMNRLVMIGFTRETELVAQAIQDACDVVRSSGGEVLGIAPDTLITLSEMGHMPGLSWGTVHALANGAGEGFPLPVARQASDRPLWNWAEVSTWLADRSYIDRSYADVAALIAAENLKLKKPVS
ncbi:MAG: hypothetical protein DI595_07685 [Agrobacterium fabrum]|uniref:DNA-binding protein n=1 Tax=Agrobacterium fabrum TaxID=1176649 RepID=A0A2W5FEF3_9HYPH|nr:MAG: hypothetical protein DI595_07685 [Agrobacterium fabrum]